MNILTKRAAARKRSSTTSLKSAPQTSPSVRGSELARAATPHDGRDTPRGSHPCGA
jgi:hypothetical protein